MKTKLKLLIVDLMFFPSNDANTNCVISLLNEIRENFEITILTENTNNSLKGYEEYNDMKIYRYSKTSIRSKGISMYARISFLIAKLKKMYYKNEINYDRICNFKLEYRNLVNVEDYDLVISFSIPFESHVCASFLSTKFRIKWMPYYLDPFSTNENLDLKNQKKRVLYEKKLLNNAECVISTDLVKNDYLNYKVLEDENVIFDLPLPIANRIEVNQVFKSSKSNEIAKIYFIGNLYWSIRNPLYAIDIFKNLNNNFELYFVGGCFDGDIVTLLKDNDIEIPENVHFLGKKSYDEVSNYIDDADVLLNIGNTISNQLPSKIFDYIFTGKPILNICKLENCPSLQYTSKYPIILNLFEKQEINDDLIKNIENFINDNKSKRIDYNVIKEIYKDIDINSVARNFMEIIKGVIYFE